MKRLSESVSFREVPLALVYSILWFVALGVFGYPEDERLGIVLIAYLTLWVSRLAVNALLGFVFERLHMYALGIVGQEGLDAIAESGIVERSSSARAFLAALALAILSVIFGLSIVAIPPVIGYMGITPLGSYFMPIAWILLGVSVIALSGLVARSFWGWSRVKAGFREPQQAPVIGMEESQGLLKRLGFSTA